MLELFATKFVAALLLPPASNLLLGLTGLIVVRRRRRFGVGLLLLAIVSLYLVSLSAVSGWLVRGLESYPALSEPNNVRGDPGAIVVLGGGRYGEAPEYFGDTVSTSSLMRLRYAAWLHRRTDLPLLVTGGRFYPDDRPEGVLMREVLEAEFGVPVRWMERNSRNTAENARMSRSILAEDGIDTVALVTNAWHMARAVAAFERVGFNVVAAPTGFSGGASNRPLLLRLLPTAEALDASAMALHEYLGRVWYGLRY